MNPSGFLPFVSWLALVCSEYGHKEPYYRYFYSLLPKETIMYKPNMNLSCGNVSVEDSPKPPMVDWYFYEYMKYRRVNCSTFWWYEYQNDLCRLGHGQYPRFEGPSSLPCSLQKDSKHYTCEYSHPDIIPLKYKCVISVHGKDQRDIKTIKIIKVKDNETMDYRKWSMKPCFLPEMVNLSGTFQSEGSIDLTWDFSKNKPISGCLRPRCNKTKTFKLKLIIFNSFSSMKKQAHSYGGDNSSEWISLNEGQTSLTIESSEISEEKYYKIIVKSMKERKGKKKYDSRGYGKMWKKEVKVKCHFGKQEPAVIEPAPEDGLLEAEIGSHVNVSCYATGNPLPTVSLQFEYDDENITLAEGTSSAHYLLSVLDSYRLFCVARNKIISPLPCGRMMYSKDSTVITISPL